MNRHNFAIIYTIFVFVALASLDNAVIGLFPPLFSSIAHDYKIPVSLLGIASAITIFVTSLSSIFWGYAADKGSRKHLIIAGTIVWSISIFTTAHSKNFYQLVISQFFTGIGLGCISAIGFSVLTDYIPKKWRGMLLSLWGLSQGFGGIAGSVMASIIATAYNWRKPFEILAILGLSFIFLYFFIKEPPKGGAEPELKDLVKEGFEYDYVIEYSHLKEIITKKSNTWLILQGFFMNLTTGTLIWLPTLYISKIERLGYSTQTSIVAAGFLFALLQTGGLSSMYFGYLGDELQRRTHRGRAMLAGGAIFATIPLYIFMFNVPMKNLQLPDGAHPAVIFAMLIKEIILNPWMLLMFLLAVGATAAQSANTPNWLALITDVNLPEHRATAFSIATLVNGIGRAMGNVLIGVVLAHISSFTHEPENYIITMTLFQLSFIPAIMCYQRVAKHAGKDIRYVKNILTIRARG